MKRLVSMMLAIIMVISLFQLGTLTVSASTFAGGDGSLENPYQISTAEQLDAIRNDLDANYILINDIDLSKYTNWIPIGNYEKGFTGTFDGNNHTISNLTIKSYVPKSFEDVYVGLFGVGNKLNNINMQNINITIGIESDSFTVGGIAGTASIIKNCSTNGRISITDGRCITVGGIVGYGLVQQSTNYVNIYATSKVYYNGASDVTVGGVAGHSFSTKDKFCNNINYGNIVATSCDSVSCGGILGECRSVYECINYGKIEGTTTERHMVPQYYGNCNVGGISGVFAVTDTEIRDCLNAGEVYASAMKNGTARAGGIVGSEGAFNGGRLDNCYNICTHVFSQREYETMDINMKSEWHISNGISGRIAGAISNASNCYSVNKTLVNDKIPTEDLSHDKKNGESKTLTEIKEMTKDLFVIEEKPYVMTLVGGYAVMLDEELEINYAVKQGEEYVHNDLDIKWEIESKDSNNAIKIISDKDNVYTRALTIKGINEGECELVAKVDGAELGRTKIEVLGNLADTISDETIIRAKFLVNNSQYQYYKNYNSVHGMYADAMELTPSIVKYSLDNYLSIFYKSIYEGKAPDEVTATEFYECVLVKLLNDEENVKVFGKAGDVMKNYILKYGKKIAKQGTKIDDTNKKQLKEICEGLCGDGLEDVGFIDTLLVSGKSIETYFEEYAKVYQMASCTNEQIKTIKLIKNAASDKALKTACDNVIKCIEQAQEDTAKYAVSGGATKTAEQLGEYAFEKMVGALEDLCPALAAFSLAQEIASPINNILFKADDIESDTIDLYALIVIENALKDAMTSAETTFNSNPTKEKAENLMAVADLYKNVQLYGCDICDSLLENYGEAKRNQGIAWDSVVIILKNVVNREVKMTDVFNALFGNVDSETLDKRKTLSDIRKLIDSADFYNSEGTDVAEFIREVKSTTPSDWAKSEINKAINYGFLPDYMQNNYQNNITRAEFCTILTWMIEKKTGKGIDELIEERGTPIKSPFEDTYYEYADYMCKLGIVNGVSATEFNPLGEITREQAATMLMRTADVLGYDTSYNTSVESGVSSWATEGVGFVTEKGIMNGTGNGFEPQGKYTKEQAIATFVRMYDNLK